MQPDSHTLQTAATDEPTVSAPPLLSIARVSDRLVQNPVERLADAGDDTPPGRAQRIDGWTPERMRIFLTALAECGVVEDACRAAGMSKKGAYNLRNRAEGGAFRVAWDAAYQLARPRVADAALSRALHGQVEVIVRDGKVVAERHRFDNRHTMSVLARLDRLTESQDEQNRAARIVSQEFDQFLDIVCAGGDGAAEFMSARRERDYYTGQQSATILERLDNYRHCGAGLAGEIDVSDLDPGDREDWTEQQVDRAERAGLLEQIEEPQDEAEDECEDAADALGEQVASAIASAAESLRHRTHWHENGENEPECPATPAEGSSEANVDAVAANVAAYESLAASQPAALGAGARPALPARTGKLPNGATLDGPPPSGWVATD